MPDCHRCRFFRVTWNARLRYECRAFGFRSARLPALAVRDSSGTDCQLFEPKTGKTRDA
ncbi:MAG: uracil-DNA glycosylase [Planctomycetota bacterium]